MMLILLAFYPDYLMTSVRCSTCRTVYTWATTNYSIYLVDVAYFIRR